MKDGLMMEYGIKHAEFEQFLMKSGIKSFKSAYWGNGSLMVRYKNRAHLYEREFFDYWPNATWKQKMLILDSLRYYSLSDKKKALAKRRAKKKAQK